MKNLQLWSGKNDDELDVLRKTGLTGNRLSRATRLVVPMVGGFVEVGGICHENQRSLRNVTWEFGKGLIRLDIMGKLEIRSGTSVINGH